MAQAVPRLVSQAATRAALIAAAEYLLREKSYAELTVRGISAKAGYTTGAFFAHFASKADLALELIVRSKSASMEALVDVINQAWAEHDHQRVGELLVQRASQIHDEMAIMLDVFAQGLRDPELAPKVGAVFYDSATQFAALRAFAELPQDGRREAAVQVFALWQGLLLQSIGQPDLNVAELFARGTRALLDQSR
jgi:AcrR family transcriptional regulator